MHFGSLKVQKLIAFHSCFREFWNIFSLNLKVYYALVASTFFKTRNCFPEIAIGADYFLLSATAAAGKLQQSKIKVLLIIKIYK